MKKIIYILFLFVSISSFSQTIRFNKSYVPIGNDLSVVLHIYGTGNNYHCYGISQYLYPQSVMAFNVDSVGNLIDSKMFGNTNLVGSCEDEESIIIILTFGILFYINSIILTLLQLSRYIKIQ